MIAKLKEYNAARGLFNKGDKLLVAVSGGIDSMVMAHLLSHLPVSCEIAHCNFGLRGTESDGDAAFVEAFAKSAGMPFHIHEFDTESYARKHCISIQMAARELRYQWFGKLRTETGASCIAVAHNADDAIETFFINLSRGTGIKGLSGMASKNVYIIRPLLFASRKEVIEYAKENGIEFREDSSNSSTKYQRNQIRHNIIPEFEKINPSFRNTIAESMKILDQTASVYFRSVQHCHDEICSNENDRLNIEIEKLEKLEPAGLFLYELIAPYGFNFSQALQIMESLNSQPGRVFHSPGHRIVRDREFLILTKNRDDEKVFTLVSPYSKEGIPEWIEIKIFERAQDYKIPNDNATACLDANKVSFPITVRNWCHGDRFVPLGMESFKKLSDYFSDHKFSLVDKEEAWIFESAGEIIWLGGHRIDDRYKITPASRLILEIKINTSLLR